MHCPPPRLRTLFTIAFLPAWIAAAIAATAIQPVAAQSNDGPAQEFYELRVYQINDFEKQQIAETYLKEALLPALNRMGIDRVGVFRNLEDVNDHSLFVLIPYPTLEHFSQLKPKLNADSAYQQAAADYFDRNQKERVYERIDSRFMKAFAGIPVIEQPEYSKQQQDRIFELRLYESHTEDHARRKVKMFNEGEIQIMRDVDMAPVFFGQTLVGKDTPNLIYMLSATDQEAHQQHWKDFLAHPEWLRIKDLEEYKGTVSNIQKWFLRPTDYSQL